MTERSGRGVRIEYEYNGKPVDKYGFTNIEPITMYNKTHPYPSNGGTETISFNDSAFNIYENETKLDEVFDYITIIYYGQGGEDYVTKYSYENNVITVTISPNISNTERHFTVALYYSVNWKHSTDEFFTFNFDYYQQGIETT